MSPHSQERQARRRLNGDASRNVDAAHPRLLLIDERSPRRSAIPLGHPRGVVRPFAALHQTADRHWTRLAVARFLLGARDLLRDHETTWYCFPEWDRSSDRAL